MGKRKVSVLETAATALADASFFIVNYYRIHVDKFYIKYALAS